MEELDWPGKLFGALRGGDLVRLRLALAEKPPGASVSHADSEGQTVLHLAASLANVPACELLLAAGADPALRDRSGGTPLSVFGRYGPKGKMALANGRDMLAAALSPGTPVPATYELILLRAPKADGTPRPLPYRPARNLTKTCNWINDFLNRVAMPSFVWYGDYRRGTIWLLPGEVGPVRALVEGTLAKPEGGGGYFVAEMAVKADE